MKGNLSQADWDADSRLVRRILPYLHSFRWSPGHFPSPSLHSSIYVSFSQSVNMPHVCTCAHGVHFIKSSSFWSWFLSSSCSLSLSPVDKRVVARFSLDRLQRKLEKLNYFCLFTFRFLTDTDTFSQLRI